MQTTMEMFIFTNLKIRRSYSCITKLSEWCFHVLRQCLSAGFLPQSSTQVRSTGDSSPAAGVNSCQFPLIDWWPVQEEQYYIYIYIRAVLGWKFTCSDSEVHCDGKSNISGSIQKNHFKPLQKTTLTCDFWKKIVTICFLYIIYCVHSNPQHQQTTAHWSQSWSAMLIRCLCVLTQLIRRRINRSDREVM